MPDDTEKQFDDRQKDEDEDDEECGIEERKLDLRRKRNREHSRLSRQRKRRRIEVLLGENEAYHRNNHALHEENLHLRRKTESQVVVQYFLYVLHKAGRRNLPCDPQQSTWL